MRNLLDWLTLFFTPGLGAVGSKRLIDHLGGVRRVLAADASTLLHVGGIRSKTAEAIVAGTGRADAARELKKIDQQGVAVIPWDDPDYPEPLRNIPDPPLLLYAKGERACLGAMQVAVVGARAATAYGREVAANLAAGLARNRITTVSGLALGIDTAAHGGALAAEGKTVAVLGCGIDIAYPRQNEKLSAAIAEKGLLLSEYPLGTPPEAFRFPARNRIISGLSRGVVVVEAARRSGSLITAALALEQGREVFAVPGSIASAKSEGCHRLIQEGAKLVHTVHDVLEELPPVPVPVVGAGNNEDAAGTNRAIGALSREEQCIVACLDAYPTRIDSIITNTNLSAQQVNSLLLGLELKGLVEALPGRQYQRTANP